MIKELNSSIKEKLEKLLVILRCERQAKQLKLWDVIGNHIKSEKSR